MNSAYDNSLLALQIDAPVGAAAVGGCWVRGQRPLTLRYFNAWGGEAAPAQFVLQRKTNLRRKKRRAAYAACITSGRRFSCWVRGPRPLRSPKTILLAKDSGGAVLHNEYGKICRGAAAESLDNFPGLALTLFVNTAIM